MSELDFFGHWGYFFLLVGLFYVGQKDKAGWLFRFFGEAIWIYLGFMLNMSSIWVWGFIFLALDVKNYMEWVAEEKAKLEAEEHERFLEETLHALPVGTWINGNTGEVLEAKQRKKQGKNLAAKRSVSSKKKVRPAARRRSKPANGKRRSGSNDVARRPKTRKNLVRV